MNVGRNGPVIEATPRVIVRLVSLLILACGFTVATAAAQGRVTATVITAAPVYLLPDNQRQPLRTLPVGTTVTISQVRGDWLEVTFVDPQFGRLYRPGSSARYVRVNVAVPEEEDKPLAPPPATAPPPRATTSTQTAGTTSTTTIGIRGFGTIAFDKVAASESFKAVAEKDTVTSFGGGIQVTNLWRGLFAEVAGETTSLDGERVFIGPDDEVFRLGIPLKIKMTPVDVIGGWRSSPFDRFTTYGGAGATFLRYEETSDFADASENVKESHTGFVLLGGVEVRAMQWVHVRGEVRYRSIKDALGVGGVSQAFDETDLGGVGFALKIAVGR